MHEKMSKCKQNPRVFMFNAMNYSSGLTFFFRRKQPVFSSDLFSAQGEYSQWHTETSAHNWIILG